MSDLFSFPRTEFARLREKANNLPLTPGVYLMKEKSGRVIYVGKSRALKNRVSQYFAPNTSHGIKTDRMTSSVFDFDVILTSSETEALNLENRLIKLHSPKYNIKLKDDRNYPYIRITLCDDYPVMSVVRKRSDDNAKYFGPYSSTGAAYTILSAVRKAFGIPSCKRSFPRDIGKIRPCLNMQIGQCSGVCTGKVSQKEYKEAYSDAAVLLSGSYSSAVSELKKKMEYASDNLMFEAAALYRDRIAELKRLWEKQRVIASPDTEQDVFAFYKDETCPVLTILYIRSGMLLDSESIAFSPEQIADEDSLTSLLFDIYVKRAFIPKEILLGFDIGSENLDLLTSLLSESAGYKVRIRTPERGDAKALCKMALDNARQYSSEYKLRSEKSDATLVRIAQLLGLEVVPERIEAYDISNFGNENITAGKIACVHGKFEKSAYRMFKITSTGGQNDYGAMREAVSRRLAHSEDIYPDLILLDGGKAHVSVIRQLLDELHVEIPVFGMVKDEHHKTRALVGTDEEIQIIHEHALFVLIHTIQEEVHRYTISGMQRAKRKTLKTSVLEKIPGVGPAKAKLLLARFRTVSAVKNASVNELASVKGISLRDAENITKWAAEAAEKQP